MFLFSNSSTKSWSFCKRAFYNSYLLLGGGVESNFVDEDLIFGTLVHEVLPIMWKGEGDLRHEIGVRRLKLEGMLLGDGLWLKDQMPEFRIVKAHEWGRLFEGVCYGIRRTVLPYLQERYVLVAAEGDAIREISPDVGLIAKPDTLLYPKESEWDLDDMEALDPPYPGLGYLEWKTVASPTPQWQAQWVKNPQSWTGAMTIRHALKLDLQWFMVVGLVKGQDRDGRRTSPWCWIYRNAERSRASVRQWQKDGYWWTVEYTNAKGWERVSTDDYPGGVAALVGDVDGEVVSKQFILTTPDDIDWELAEEWLGNQEELWKAALKLKSLVDVEHSRETLGLFPRSLEKCNTGQFNKPCGFRRLCHDPEVNAEPLTFYRRRVPHHELERGDE
jgi:hypothetical protein